jgi:hypothetical protein
MAPRFISPSRPIYIAWVGSGLIGIAALIGIFLLPALNSESSQAILEGKINNLKKVEPISFSLSLNEKPPTIPLPQVVGEMTFSFDPPRPNGGAQTSTLFVRLKKSAQSKRVSLPSRLDLRYLDGDRLAFSEEISPFWIELSLNQDKKIEGGVYIDAPPLGKAKAESFTAAAQEAPIQSPGEFPEKTPFRILGDARWCGHDAFGEKYEGGGKSQRLEVGPSPSAEFLQLNVGEWISWNGTKWVSGLSEKQGAPIARIESVQGKALLLEGWDADTHVRLSIGQGTIAPLKIKPEELFNSIRVRSEKQISCMMDKQCLILRVGDWVLKSDGRWKILRKAEEKAGYTRGKAVGELFVFDKIDTKQGQKLIMGHLFNAEKTQILPVEMAAHSRSARGAKEAKGRTK